MSAGCSHSSDPEGDQQNSNRMQPIWKWRGSESKLLSFIVPDYWNKYESSRLCYSCQVHSRWMSWMSNYSPTLYLKVLMNSAVNILQHWDKEKACSEKLRSSWNWLISCVIKALMLLIVWVKDPGTMWQSRCEMTLHKLILHSVLGKIAAAWPWNQRFVN